MTITRVEVKPERLSKKLSSKEVWVVKYIPRVCRRVKRVQIINPASTPPSNKRKTVPALEEIFIMILTVSESLTTDRRRDGEKSDDESNFTILFALREKREETP